MPSRHSYIDVATARDLEGRERTIYRVFEILPGLLTVLTLVGVFFASWLIPIWTAFFIIAFDLYWLVKTVFLSIHLRVNWRKMKYNMKLDWEERLKNMRYDHLWQMVILPFYKEGYEVVSESTEALLTAKWPNERMIIVWAYEERAGSEAEEIAKKVQEEYKDKFAHFLIVKHPKDLLGEISGKGSNIAWAARRAREEVLDKYNIKYEDVLVNAFDSDTRVYPQYFLCATWHFLTAEKPFRSSFQPVPVYNNNIWDAPAFSRVVATSATFWQMIQQERPERLATFSSHTINFKTLHEIGYWQTNMVNEDSRIFWNAFLYYNGDYRVVPISYPVSMDANLAPTLWRTAKNVYKQQHRWTYGSAENTAYLMYGFLKNKSISLREKVRLLFVNIEGTWSLATNPLIIFFLGWLPLTLGGEAFNRTVLSYNLPRMTRNIMTVAMLGLVMSAIISFSFLPPIPPHKRKHKYAYMVLQWILIPVTIPFFSAIPGLDAQIRLMLGKYMGFWVTPKHRK